MQLSGTSFLPPRSCLGLLAIFWVLFATPSSLLAQMLPGSSSEPAVTVVEISEHLTQEQVRDLIAHMSDDQVRDLVISQLDKLAAEQNQAGDSAGYINHLQNGFDVARNTLMRALQADN